MIEAYKIGVTLALTNKVSGALGIIIGDMNRADMHAQRLKDTLKEIKLLGLAGAAIGGAGLLGLKVIGSTVEPAKQYVHQLELARAAGMEHLDVVRATKAAWDATRTVSTTTAAENIAAIRELRMVFGDTSHAIEHMPVVQKLQAILQNVRGGSGGNEEAYTVAKALEMKGAVRNPAQFENAADMMTKAIIASGGKVGAADFLSAFKFGRAATLGWDDRFTYSILPTLIQEMKSAGGGGGTGGPGNALMSAYAAVVGGTIPQKALAVWQSLGLLDPSKVIWNKVGSAKGVQPGGIKGSDLFQQDPERWAREVLVPALTAHGIGTEEKQRQTLQYLFPNRTAGFVMGQLALQGWKFQRDEALINKASGLSSYDDLIKHDPMMAQRAAEQQWKNLKTVIGLEVIPILIPVLRGLTGAFQEIAGFMRRHPTLTRALVLTFGALSLVATLGGSLLIGAAGLKAVGLALGMFPSASILMGAARGVGAIGAALAGGGIGSAATGLASLPLLGIAAGLAALGAAAVGFVWLVKEHGYSQEDQIRAGQRGPGGRGADPHNPRYQVGPPPSSKKTVVEVPVYLDKRKIAKSVAEVWADEINRPLSGASTFDGKFGFVAP